MEERGNKTIICSVFFLDIVEYSKKSVSGQISLKERFNAFLSEAIRDVPIDDRIILDTGDGAAISFLGDVEDALRAALSMRDSLNSEEGRKEPALLVRMGINLGPVRLVRDINGQPNIVGDGINVAQRVMGFAENGQILVSRSYYDAASRLSQAYAGMFQYVGSRTDKHVREHEVYIIGKPGEQTSEQRMASGETSSGTAKEPAAMASAWSGLTVKSGELYAKGLALFQQATPALKAVYLGVPVVFLLLVLLLVKLVHRPAAVPDSQLAAVKTGPAVSTQMAAQAASAPAAVASAAKQQPAVEHHKTEAKKDTHKADTKSDAHKADSKKDAKAKGDAKTKGDSKKKQAMGEVMLTVKPWGEVYLDGKLVDVSPPLTRLEVAAGAHVIELKNANFPVYKRPINIKAGQKININYRFSN